MSDFILSPNMSLPLPIPGVDPGPDYAFNQNTAFGLVDTHDHSAGKGVPITPAGMNISVDLPFSGNNATQLRSTRFSSQGSPLALPADLACVYVSGVDLYYNDGAGNQVRITQSGGVAGSPGSISNLTSPASAAYVAADQTFVWESDASTAANMDGGSVTIREVAANAKGITISSPGSLASDYEMILPGALPAAQKFLTLDNAGNVAASWAVDNSSLAVSSNFVQVKDAGITSAKMASNVDLPGTQVQANGKNLIVQGANTTTNMKIIRGRVAANGASTPVTGEGWTCTSHTVGQYSISFTTPFASVPVVVATAINAGYIANVQSAVVPGAFSSEIIAAGSHADSDWTFIAIGPA